MYYRFNVRIITTPHDYIVFICLVAILRRTQKYLTCPTAVYYEARKSGRERGNPRLFAGFYQALPHSINPVRRLLWLRGLGKLCHMGVKLLI